MKGIGHVLYSKGNEPGTLEARWCHSTQGQGTGKASGGPAEGFPGTYRIRYFDDDGEVLADLELEIRRTETGYELTWRRDGRPTAEGVGVEIAEGLAAGWHDTGGFD